MPARKPSKTKKLQGTERKHRVNGAEPKPTIGRPEPYGELTAPELKHYDRIATDLSALGVLAVTDGGVLSGAAINLASVDRIRTEIRALKSAGDAENFHQWSALMIREEARSKMHRAYMQSLGLTPVDRARVSAIDKGEEEDNPWERFV